MSKQEEKSGKTAKKRSSVKVVTSEKEAREEVHVNAYFEKNDTRRKKRTSAKNSNKTTSNKTTKKKSTNTTAKKKTTANKPKKTNNAKIKSETKKPASFSETAKPKTEKKVEEPKVEVKAERVEEPKVEESKPEEFETLKINTKIEKPESKIILRDVAKPVEEIEQKAAEPIAPILSEKTEVAEKSQALQSAEKVEILPEPAGEAKPALIEPEPIKVEPIKPTAKEIKEREIEKAVKTATKLPETSRKRSRKSSFATNFGWPRMVLAVACAATAMFAIVYFVNLTSTDMSLKVAAMQSGIEASYPSYVPRGYNLSDVTSASGKVTMNFKTDDSAFSISEENTTWDSDALLSNYIKPTYDEEYTVVREQGLTLYMGSNWEAWVNGGILYKLQIKSGTLTKKQMKTIATSL